MIFVRGQGKTKYLAIGVSSFPPEYDFLNRSLLFKQIKPTRCTILSDLLLIVEIQLNMFRASSCPSSGAYQLQ
jgi:hypothetical protein